MSYRVEITKKAEKQIGRMDKRTAQRIADMIVSLVDDPRPVGCKKLVGDDRWRVRLGDYRILYLIEDDVLIVTVVEVAHRREVYRRK